MVKRIFLTLSDEAAAILADRQRIPFRAQGRWVSRAIIERAAREDADRERQLEAELARLRAQRQAKTGGLDADLPLDR